MTKQLRNLVLGAASILALGIGGAAQGHAANAVDAVNAGRVPLAFGSLDGSGTDTFLRKDDIRWAQLELRNRGLYQGSLDGVLGPETKRALDQFQGANGLDRTASLDAQTWEALIGDTGGAQGSSRPPSGADHAPPGGNSSAASNWGR